MESDILVSMATDSVNVMSIRPDGSREFKTAISLGSNFHGFIETAIDWHCQLNSVDLGTILTDPNLLVRTKKSTKNINQGCKTTDEITKFRSYNICEMNHLGRITTQRSGRSDCS